MNSEDLWTIHNPPWWAGQLPGIVANNAESVTLCLAIRPEQSFIEFAGVEAVEPIDVKTPLRIRKVFFDVDHSKHELIFKPRANLTPPA